MTQGIEPKSQELSTKFFHRKLARSGGSRVMTVNQILPNDWHFVKVRLIGVTNKKCVLELYKLD